MGQSQPFEVVTGGRTTATRLGAPNGRRVKGGGEKWPPYRENDGFNTSDRTLSADEIAATVYAAAEAAFGQTFERLGASIELVGPDRTRSAEEILEERAYQVEREDRLLREIASLQAALADYRQHADTLEVQIRMKSEEHVPSIPIVHTVALVLSAILLTSGLLCLLSAAGRTAVPPAIAMFGILCGICLVGTTLLSLWGHRISRS